MSAYSGSFSGSFSGSYIGNGSQLTNIDYYTLQNLPQTISNFNENSIIANSAFRDNLTVNVKTRLNAETVVSSSVQISASAAAAGFGTAGAVLNGLWGNIDGKPAGLVSSSTQTVTNLIGTSISASSFSGSYYGDGSNLTGVGVPTGTVSSSAQTISNLIGSDLVVASITAEQYVISSSVTYMTTSFSSGSTIFGNSADDTHTFTGDITASGDISASGTMYATTVSASLFSGSYYGDGSNLTGVSGYSVANSANNRIITSVDSSNGNAEASLTFDGSSLIVTGSTTLYRSGSVGDTDVLTINGAQGNLFSITDELSGSLFSVNDISGLPVLEVFSDNTMKMGPFGAEAIFVSNAISGSSVGIGHVPTYRFDVSGSARITDTLTVNTTIYTSQTDLKKEISGITKTKAKVIEFKEYQFKKNGRGRKRYGVLAEDIEDDYPELVYVGPDGVKGVNYIDLLVKRVAELEKELADVSGSVGNHLSNVTSMAINRSNKLEIVIGRTTYTFTPDR